jgi:hypothetical protein
MLMPVNHNEKPNMLKLVGAKSHRVVVEMMGARSELYAACHK